jgi:hypothetical protein
MRTSLALALISCVAVLSGCGDNLERPVDAAVVDSSIDAVDAAIIDVPIDVAIDAIDAPGIDANCPARTPGEVGGACVTDANCDTAVGAADGICLRGALGSVVWPAQGFCITKYDGCTVDADCGANNLCATISDPLGDFRACLPACGTGACACSNGQLCASSFSGSVIQGGDMACLPGNASATDGDTCVGFGECPQDSLCLNDSLEYPGGQCHTVTCTIGNDTTCAAGGDGHCVDLGAITAGLNTGAVCVDRCTADTDCRQADGYRCFDGGGAVGRYCRHPQAGDACAADADCGNAALWDCKIGLTFPGGMCTPTTGCPTPGSGQGCSPTSSICYDSVLPAVPTDNVCANRCGGPIGTQGGCRSGYVCRDTDPGSAVVLGCVNP